jgi:predicted MFS family arabinose efflux permease
MGIASGALLAPLTTPTAEGAGLGSPQGNSVADLSRYAALFFFISKLVSGLTTSAVMFLPDDGAARHEAKRIEAALRHCRRPVWSVIVTNECGHEVTEILAPSQSPGADEPERTTS